MPMLRWPLELLVTDTVAEVVDVWDVVDVEPELELFCTETETTGPEPEPPTEMPVPIVPTECTLPTTLMLEPEEPVTETTGVPLGLIMTEPGLVTVPPGLTTVITVRVGLLEPDPAPAPATLTTGTGVEATGVGVGLGGVEVVGVEPVLPEVGLNEEPREGVPATGREIEAELECRCDLRVGRPCVATLVRVPARAATKEAAEAAVFAPARGLTTATAARPREEEAWEPALGWAVSVCVAGAPLPSSFGQPL
jgi:hypothetical protein